MEPPPYFGLKLLSLMLQGLLLPLFFWQHQVTRLKAFPLLLMFSEMFSVLNINDMYWFPLLPPACDSCVITLLKDLSTIGDELQLIKSQLQNVHASSHTLEQMRDLETRIKDLKVGKQKEKSRFWIKWIGNEPRNLCQNFVTCKKTYINPGFQIPDAGGTGFHLLEGSCGFHVMLWNRISISAFSGACSPWKLYLWGVPLAMSFSSISCFCLTENP